MLIKTPGIFSGKKNSRFKASCFLMFLCFLNLEFGCTYYKVHKTGDLTEDFLTQKLGEQVKQDKYIIIHKDGVNYHIFNIQMSRSEKVLTASYEYASKEHNQYNPDVRSNRRYYNRDGGWNVLNEVHIVADTIRMNPDSKVQIPLSSIRRIDVIDKDTGRIAASYVFTVVVIASVVLLAAALIALSSVGY